MRYFGGFTLTVHLLIIVHSEIASSFNELIKDYKKNDEAEVVQGYYPIHLYSA